MAQEISDTESSLILDTCIYLEQIFVTVGKLRMVLNEFMHVLLAVSNTTPHLFPSGRVSSTHVLDHDLFFMSVECCMN